MSEQVNQVNFLNWWSLIHFCFWFAVAFTWKKSKEGVPLGRVLVVALVGAYVWEVVEYALAVLPALWALTESGWNRWVSDPLMALIAAPIGWWAAKATESAGHHRRQPA